MFKDITINKYINSVDVIISDHSNRLDPITISTEEMPEIEINGKGKTIVKIPIEADTLKIV